MKKIDKILICIPTFNRNKSLLACINSIKKLKEINSFNVQILVLDNSPSNTSYNLINKYKKKGNIKITQRHELKRGIVFARNKCLQISRDINPKYIAFIDDDCKVDKNWLINIFNLFNKISVDIITGPQKYEKNKNEIQNDYSLLFEKKHKKKFLKVKWAASNNVFLRYDILKKNKKIIFDKNLNKFGMGEDQLFFSLISKRGYKIYWSSNIFVTEKMHPHRININWVKERSKRLGILGHYIDIQIYGMFLGIAINYLKSLYLISQTIFFYFNLFALNRNLNLVNKYYRFYGKIVGPFKFKKIKFLK